MKNECLPPPPAGAGVGPARAAAHLGCRYIDRPRLQSRNQRSPIIRNKTTSRRRGGERRPRSRGLPRGGRQALVGPRGASRSGAKFANLSDAAGSSAASAWSCCRDSTSCASPAPQLKRDWSLLAIFGRANRSYHDISNTWLAHGFRSSSSTCPASQSRLPLRIPGGRGKRAVCRKQWSATLGRLVARMCSTGSSLLGDPRSLLGPGRAI